MNKPDRIFADEVERVESAEILVDVSTRTEPVLGLRFIAEDGAGIVVPMSLDFAEHVAKELLSYSITYRKFAEHDRL